MKRALTFLVLTGVLLTLLPINLQSKEKEILARLDQLVETLERMERKGDVQSAEVSQIYAKLKVVLSNLETLQKKQIEQEQPERHRYAPHRVLSHSRRSGRRCAQGS